MPRRSKRYIIELDGATYEVSGNKIEPIADLRDVKGNCWLVTDMQEAIARSMTVEAHVKYVEVMLPRKLQETGEFGEPASIITHWKKKQSKNVSEIFFTALPHRLYSQYQDMIQARDDCLILLPVYAVLHGVLKHTRSLDPVAVIFQHNRFADMVVGRKNRIYAANRFVTFDTHEEQISALWDTIRADIQAIEADQRIRIDTLYLLTWMDTGPPPQWPEEEGRGLYHLEDETVYSGGDSFNISFIKALGLQGIGQSASSAFDKMLYLTSSFSPFLTVLVILAALLLGAGHFWFDNQADMRLDELKRLERSMSNIQMSGPPLQISNEKIKQTLQLIKDMDHYRTAVPYRDVVNDISEALGPDMKLEVLKADYMPDAVQLEVFGKIRAPFNQAYKGYQGFLRILEKKGYAMSESRFDTQIEASQFLITLTRTAP